MLLSRGNIYPLNTISDSYSISTLWRHFVANCHWQWQCFHYYLRSFLLVTGESCTTNSRYSMMVSVTHISADRRTELQLSLEIKMIIVFAKRQSMAALALLECDFFLLFSLMAGSNRTRKNTAKYLDRKRIHDFMMAHDWIVNSWKKNLSFFHYSSTRINITERPVLPYAIQSGDESRWSSEWLTVEFVNYWQRKAAIWIPKKSEDEIYWTKNEIYFILFQQLLRAFFAFGLFSQSVRRNQCLHGVCCERLFDSSIEHNSFSLYVQPRAVTLWSCAMTMENWNAGKHKRFDSTCVGIVWYRL